MTVTLVVAVARNGVIGRDGGMPWRLSTDLARFKVLTLGHPVVMGRKTWESMPKRPLPGRTNIVITRDPGFSAEGALVAHSLDKALEAARSAEGGDDVKIIGGGQIYAAAMGAADRLDVTHVMIEPEGDTRFPDIDPALWRVSSSEDVPAGPKNDFATRFVVYERR